MVSELTVGVRARAGGRLIAFEGIDAAGKSTQARLLAAARCAVLTFQFGATDTGAVIRRLLLNPADDTLDVRTEALLVMADKAQHVAEVVGPALEAGHDVVTDRYTASALAYQGYGRGLDIGSLRSMLDFATRGLTADLTVLLDIDPHLVHRRLAAESDRFESAAMDASFVGRVRSGYLELASLDPERWAVVDACGSIEEVAARVDRTVKDHLS